MTETKRTAAQAAEQPGPRAGGDRRLCPVQLQALAREVLRLMRSELRGELDRRGQASACAVDRAGEAKR